MYRVLITDEHSGGYHHNDSYFTKLADWARESCASYVGCVVTDVSDNSYEWDEITAFNFTDEKDATWFALKWKI